MSCENCEKLQRELLSALAAIEKHNKSLEGSAAERHIEPIDVDLSLLHEHDAEVRKPLVDAGNKMRRTMYSNDSEEAKAWDDALAKVKENR